MSDPEIEQARRRGWAAFINGTPRILCPYMSAALREAWLAGWDESASQPHAVLL